MAPIISKPIPKRDPRVEDSYKNVERALRPVLDAFLDAVEACLCLGGVVASEASSALSQLQKTIDKTMLNAARAVVDSCFCDTDRMTRGSKSTSSALPTVFVITLIVFLYNAFVFCYMPAAGIALNSTTSIIFHACMVLLLASYSQAVRTDPGTVPNTDAWTTFGSPPETTEAKKHGGLREPRWCQRSNVYKPDRAHYCKASGRVVLRMDHHCPWIRNTVGFANHKFFYLFIAYASALSSSLGVSIWCLLMKVSLQPLSAFVLMGNGMLALALSALLVPFLAFHTWLLTKNMTTIEFCAQLHAPSATSASKYDQGIFSNFASVLGANPCLWWLPYGAPPGDGLSFPVNDAYWAEPEVDDCSLPPSKAHCGSASTASSELDPETVHPVATPAPSQGIIIGGRGSSSRRGSNTKPSNDALGHEAHHNTGASDEGRHDKADQFEEWDEANGSSDGRLSAENPPPDSCPSLAESFFVWTSAAEFKDDLREGCLMLGAKGTQCCVETNWFIAEDLPRRLSSIWTGSCWSGAKQSEKQSEKLKRPSAVRSATEAPSSELSDFLSDASHARSANLQ